MTYPENGYLAFL